MFKSKLPEVRLIKAFETPFRNVISTARTCYSSKGIIEDKDVSEKHFEIAKSIYEAGHHTTFQHAHFQFALSNVSRNFIWSFLHSHPFYNSEQVSQRYVTVKKDSYFIPEINREQEKKYREIMDLSFDYYEKICTLLEPHVEKQFYKRFNKSERMESKHKSTIRKKTQEVARYVLPIATHAYLYHTISGITLLRYYRMCNQYDCPSETKHIVKKMIEELLKYDPEYGVILEEPIDIEKTPEYIFYQNNPEILNGLYASQFVKEFDSSLDGKVSKLVSYSNNAEQSVADAVRCVLGIPIEKISNEEAISLAIDPSKNKLLAESLNLTTMHKLGRVMHHAGFTFKKKLSHSADSQEQRHRMTPGSRPVLSSHIDGKPDYITPEIIKTDHEINLIYQECMNRIWEGVSELKKIGCTLENSLYCLPNAVSVRFVESADYMNLRHKHSMRLCYNAQDEIWRASVEEASQIREIFPLLGANLLPPCTIRYKAKCKPICPEGNRYCGVIVWKKDLKEYERLI